MHSCSLNMENILFCNYSRQRSRSQGTLSAVPSASERDGKPQGEDGNVVVVVYGIDNLAR